MSELLELKTRLEGIIRAINDVMHLGRPPGSNIVLEVEPILLSSLQNGLNIRQACLQAGISHNAFYIEWNRNPAFFDRIEKAEQFASMKSRQNILKAINNGSVTDSWRYLERKDPEFKPKSDLTSDDKPLKTALVEFVGDDGTKSEN